jgi:hypothetical protein
VLRAVAILTSLTLFVLVVNCGGSAEPPAPASSVESQPAATAAPATPSPPVAAGPLKVEPSFRAPGDDRLIIEKLALDAPITTKEGQPNGQPAGDGTADDVVLSDYGASTRFGGLPGQGGNSILVGKVDSGSAPCRGGTVPPPCAAVLWNLAALEANDLIKVRAKGAEVAYSVAAVCWVTTAQFGVQIVERTPVEILTLVTAAGTFDQTRRVYSHNIYVRAVKQGEALASNCPLGANMSPIPAADVSFTSITTPGPGQTAVLRGQSVPDAECRMRLLASEQAEPIYAARSTGNNRPPGVIGQVTFSWVYPAAFTRGRIEVNCGGQGFTQDVARPAGASVAPTPTPRPASAPTQLTLSYDKQLLPGSVPNAPGNLIPHRFSATGIAPDTAIGLLAQSISVVPALPPRPDGRPEAVAAVRLDQGGLIVFVPSETPSGRYEITLRLPDGRVASAALQHTKS